MAGHAVPLADNGGGGMTGLSTSNTTKVLQIKGDIKTCTF